MPTFRVTLMVDGSDRFAIEAPDLEAARELADDMVQDNAWEPHHSDHSYTIIDVEEDK